MIFLKGLFFPLHEDRKNNDFQRGKYKLSREAKLPEVLDESSGIASLDSGYISHNDSGDEPVLYELGADFKLIQQVEIEEAEATDWEEVTRDDEGNLYIGDFGNNGNSRRNLSIYKYDPSQKQVHKMRFQYPDQQEFPPEPHKMNFDCEAMFWNADSLYLISKHRGEKWVKMYVLPDSFGYATAQLIDSIYLKGPITAADISPNRQEFVLLSYGHIYFFEVNVGKINFSRPKSVLYKGRLGQSEAISYRTASELVITNEEYRKVFLLDQK